VTYAGSFGLPQSGGLLIVLPDGEPLRVSSIAFDARRDTAQAEDRDLRNLLREVIAIRKVGGKK
jgi:hypothetical protein